MPNKGRSKRKTSRKHSTSAIDQPQPGGTSTLAANSALPSQASPVQAHTHASSHPTTVSLANGPQPVQVRSKAVDFENKRILCVLCGMPGTRHCPGLKPNEKTRWLDFWLVFQTRGTSGTNVRAAGHGVGHITEDQWDVVKFQGNFEVKIDGLYAPDCDVVSRPAHPSCVMFINPEAVTFGGLWGRPVDGMLHGEWARVLDLTRDTSSPTSSVYIGRFSDYSDAPMFTQWNADDLDVNYMIADPLSYQTCVVSSPYDPPVARQAETAPAGNGGGIFSLPVSLIDCLAEYILALSPRQPWACKGTAQERRERIAAFQEYRKGKALELGHLEGPEVDGDFDAVDCNCKSCTDLKRGCDPTVTRNDLMSRRFIGERALLALRATCKTLYHYSFTSKVFNVLISARAHRCDGNSIIIPFKSKIHYCEPDPQLRIVACSHGYEGLVFEPACSRPLTALQQEAADGPASCQHNVNDKHRLSNPYRTKFKSHAQRHSELLQNIAIEEGIAFQAERLYRATTGSHALRNRERMMRNNMRFQDRLMDVLDDQVSRGVPNRGILPVMR